MSYARFISDPLYVFPNTEGNLEVMKRGGNPIFRATQYTREEAECLMNCIAEWFRDLATDGVDDE